MVSVENGLELLLCDFSFFDKKLPDSIPPEIIHIQNGFNAFALGAENSVFEGEMGFLQKVQIRTDENEVVAENEISARQDDGPDDKFF